MKKIGKFLIFSFVAIVFLCQLIYIISGLARLDRKLDRIEKATITKKPNTQQAELAEQEEAMAQSIAILYDELSPGYIESLSFQKLENVFLHIPVKENKKRKNILNIMCGKAKNKENWCKIWELSDLLLEDDAKKLFQSKAKNELKKIANKASNTMEKLSKNEGELISSPSLF